MVKRESDPERLRVIRELLAEAEGETSHTVDDALARQGAVAYLSKKLQDERRVEIRGD